MTRRMLVRIGIIAGLTVCFALALSAFFIPEYLGRGARSQPHRIFLRSDVHIRGKIELDHNEASHFVGERFRITFVIQYRSEFAEPDTSSLANALLEPFEIVEVNKPKYAEATSGIYEVRVVMTIMTVEGLPGSSYPLKPVPLSYKDRITKHSKTISIPWPVSLHVARYYGRDLRGLDLKPLKQAPQSSAFLRRIIWLSTSLGMFFIVLGIGVVRVLRRFRKSKEQQRVKSELEMLHEEFTRFVQEDVLRRDPAILIEELEALSMRLLAYAKIDPYLFWTAQAGHLWRDLMHALQSRYQKDAEIQRCNVERICSILPDLFRELIAQESTPSLSQHKEGR